MGQTQSISHRGTSQTHRSYNSIRSQSVYSKRIEHQGLLTLRPVPFKNCIEIRTQTSSLFLQNIQITLRDLLNSRLYTNKLFPKQDVERLIENVTYTLAYLAENNIPYKDVAPENVFYDDGVFKLLPNELIPESRYQRFLATRVPKKASTPTSQENTHQQEFITLSPEMIIAYRCKQPHVSDLDILDKSNVFSLGLILLETCTLLPSYECYDEETCDILDEVVTERLELVREFYSQEIAAIVANMLDYDYSERMGLKEVSIFVNRELNRDLITNSKIVKELSNKKPSKPQRFIDVPPSSDPTIDDAQSVVNHSQTKSAISKSRIEQTQESDSRITRPSHNISVSQKKRNKTNKVYMNGGVQMEPEEESVVVPATKQERNKIYMKQSQVQQPPAEQKKPFNNDSQPRSQGVLKQIPHANNIINSTNDSRAFPSSNKQLNLNMRQKHTLPAFSQKSSPYQVNNQEDSQNHYPQHQDYPPQRSMKRKNSTDYLGYRAPTQPRQQTNEMAFYHGQSNRFDSLEALNEDSGSRGYFENTKPIKQQQGGKTEFRGDDNSLSRIKSEIERSRKLIEEFKRGENVQFS